MGSQLSHEKLKVYQYALKFVSWKEMLLTQIDGNIVVLDHLDRASESIVESIANGNSRRSASDRNRYFDIAIGSGLECAACLDICRCKELILVKKQVEGKEQLQHIVRMTVGLKSVISSYVKEDSESYMVKQNAQVHIFFPHESLEVYQQGLILIRWLESFLHDTHIAMRYMRNLDKTATSIVLNIAEGNGRSGEADHRKFLDIAHTCAINTASGLDLLVAKGIVHRDQIVKGKGILARLIPLLLGLRDYFNQSRSSS